MSCPLVLWAVGARESTGDSIVFWVVTVVIFFGGLSLAVLFAFLLVLVVLFVCSVCALLHPFLELLIYSLILPIKKERKKNETPLILGRPVYVLLPSAWIFLESLDLRSCSSHLGWTRWMAASPLLACLWEALWVYGTTWSNKRK